MITHVNINNYRSIWRASVELAPFTLLVGANGTGKSNFLRLLQELSLGVSENTWRLDKHKNHLQDHQSVQFRNDKGQEMTVEYQEKPVAHLVRGEILPELSSMRVYAIDPESAGKAEGIVKNPQVLEDGAGVVQVLDALKTGDREDLFNTIEARLQAFIPEIDKLSFIPGSDKKQLQVREKHIDTPIPVSELSDGTRLVLTILTLIYQENPPSVIGLEEIDRSLHPRLFEQVDAW